MSWPRFKPETSRREIRSSELAVTRQSSRVAQHDCLSANKKRQIDIERGEQHKIMHINKRLFFSTGHHKNSKLFALFSPTAVWSLARPTGSHGVLTLLRHRLRTTVFWQVTPCDLVEMCQRFGEACCRCRPPRMRK